MPRTEGGGPAVDGQGLKISPSAPTSTPGVSVSMMVLELTVSLQLVSFISTSNQNSALQLSQ